MYSKKQKNTANINNTANIDNTVNIDKIPSSVDESKAMDTQSTTVTWQPERTIRGSVMVSWRETGGLVTLQDTIIQSPQHPHLLPVQRHCAHCERYRLRFLKVNANLAPNSRRVGRGEGYNSVVVRNLPPDPDSRAHC